MTGLRRVVMVAAAAALAAACGVPTDAAPRDLAAERLPDGLLSEQTTTTTTAPDPGETPEEVLLTVYLLDGEAELVRPTNRTAPDDTVGEMITQLKELTQRDIDNGLITLITPDVTLVSPTQTQEMIAGNTLRLPLSEEFYALEGRSRSLAAAQLVFTITATPRFDAVLFVDSDDEPQLIPTSESELPDQPRPMTRLDFTGFNPLLAAGE
ncbi:MAG: GerMN domain-containing protein [Actinomycetota bacterium]